MPKGRKTPIYAMTGHNGEKEIQKTIEVGCTQCFSKTGLETIRIVIKQINLHFESEKIREIS
jgi:CheY-like chemotaxis protein